jgi:CheY-like chemotaxis protein
MGLAVSFAVIERHGGSIDVESEPGAGSTFTVRLPAAAARQTADGEPAPAPEAPSVRAACVLVIEDDARVRDLVRQLLLRLGHEVTLALDGQEGVEWLARRPFDLVITDLAMPRADGRTVIREASRLRPQVPIVLMSGYGEETQDGLAQQVASQEVTFISKPFRLVELAETIGSLLARQHHAG